MIEERILLLLMFLVPALCVTLLSWGILEYIWKLKNPIHKPALPPVLVLILLLIVLPIHFRSIAPGETGIMVSQFVFFFIAAMALLVVMLYLGDRNIFRTFPLFTVFLLFFLTVILVISHLLLGNPEFSSFFRIFLIPETSGFSVLMETLSNMIMFFIYLICASLIVFPLVYLEKRIRDMREHNRS